MMKFLFIPSIKSGDWDTLYLECAVIFVFWILVVVAVLLDLWSGIDRAKALKERLKSDKLRRTIEKIGDYWRILAFGLILDIVASVLWRLPYVSMLASAGCILIELKSVIENSRAKKSAVAKIPEVIASILKCNNKEEAANLIEKIYELGDKHNENKETEE